MVAEGVEHAFQRQVLEMLSCDEMQGFFLARPLPAPQLVEWIAGRAPIPAS